MKKISKGESSQKLFYKLKNGKKMTLGDILFCEETGVFTINIYFKKEGKNDNN